MIDAKKVVEAIDIAYENAPTKAARAYLGASIIGQRCDAALAFSMRGFPDNKTPPRLARVFDMGHRLEDVVVADLRKAGLDIMDKDPLTGRQFAMEAYGGHFKAHMDGQVVDGQDVGGLEIKSMNAKSWEDFKTNGVRHSHPVYFLQMQSMMHFGKFQWFLFVAYNKNTSEYHAQVVDYDPLEGLGVEARIETVMGGTVRRIAKDESDWRCKGCFKLGACWHPTPVAMKCMTCKFSRPDAAGGWRCEKHGRKATEVCGDFVVWSPEAKA